CTLNAADEIAVEAFLEGRISFPSIADTVEETLSRLPWGEPATIEDVIRVDEESRTLAREIVARATR
ncbi:MAG: 1-deoxy-D-xylulose-5-phosphate reductoisomerase, partial [Bryobacteraceae bacterium]